MGLFFITCYAANVILNTSVMYNEMKPRGSDVPTSVAFEEDAYDFSKIV
jgi:hypothetical protein